MVIPVKTECPHCGQEFKKLNDGVIPTHDWPPPCRAVCPGSGERPRKKDSPLWMDDKEQRAKDFFIDARNELLLYGFAVVKQMAVFTGTSAGVIKCPLCGKSVRWSLASNGHCAAMCDTSKCINATE